MKVLFTFIKNTANVLLHHVPNTSNVLFSFSDDIQDPAEDEQQFGRLKDWINSYHLHKIEVTDLSHFSDISVKFNYEFDTVKEENDGQQYPKGNQSPHRKGEE